MKYAPDLQGDGWAPFILVVGDLQTRRSAMSMPNVSGIEYCDVRDIPDVLQRYQPDLVISLLIDGDFDAMEIARHLQRVNYAGRYRILCEAVPSQTIVLGELCDAAPDLDIDFLIIE